MMIHQAAHVGSGTWLRMSHCRGLCVCSDLFVHFYKKGQTGKVTNRENILAPSNNKELIFLICKAFLEINKKKLPGKKKSDSIYRWIAEKNTMTFKHTKRCSSFLHEKRNAN